MLWMLLWGCTDKPPTVSPVDTGVLTPIPFCVNEFMPSNAGSLVIDGGSPDWIELHNPTGDDLVLDGFWLSDDPEEARKTDLSGISLAAGEFVVLASERELTFRLSADGESIVLTAEDGRLWSLEFGLSGADVAWARTTDCCEDDCWEALNFGTPGGSNEEVP